MFVLHPARPVFHSSPGELTWRSSRFAGVSYFLCVCVCAVLLSVFSCFKSSSAHVSAEKGIAVVRNTTLTVILHGRPLILEPSGGFAPQNVYFFYFSSCYSIFWWLEIFFLNLKPAANVWLFLRKLPEFASAAVTLRLSADLFPKWSWYLVRQFASKLRRNWKH